jgi:hypothetical protein
MNQNKNAVLEFNDFNTEIDNLNDLCAKLLKTPHYAKLGYEGVFAILTDAKTLGIDPFVALNGGLYYVKGKVEMSARLMNAKIREGKHSITKDKRSDDTTCILHGKRSDTQDTWTESFSIQEAQKAGLDKNPVWKNYTRDMLFARALSRLARQLFPDVIGNCYVEGEIAYDPNIPQIPVEKNAKQKLVKEDTITEETITIDQCEFLYSLLQQCPEYYQKVSEFFNKKGITSLDGIPISTYERIVQGAYKAIEELTKATDEQLEEKEPEEMSEVADE